MTDASPDVSVAQRCLFLGAVVTVCATLVLLGLGAAVTNLKAGMADPVWPTSPTALAQSSPEQLSDVRWVVEHSHRLAGYIVGCCSIGLVVGLWLVERRRWVCWLGTVALLGVILQGVIGGFRVLEHARWGLELRIAHGCFAQIVFGLLVAVALLTSPAWRRAVIPSPLVDRLKRGSLHVLGAVYVQIVLGVVLRHTYQPLAQRAHLLFAFIVAVGLIWLAALAFRSGDRMLRRFGFVLLGLLGLQIVLGVETWMVQLGREFHTTANGLPEMLSVTAQRVALRTAHVLGGSLVFAATLSVALLARRPAVAVASSRGTKAPLEEAA